MYDSLVITIPAERVCCVFKIELLVGKTISFDELLAGISVNNVAPFAPVGPIGPCGPYSPIGPCGPVSPAPATKQLAVASLGVFTSNHTLGCLVANAFTCDNFLKAV